MRSMPSAPRDPREGGWIAELSSPFPNLLARQVSSSVLPLIRGPLRASARGQGKQHQHCASFPPTNSSLISSFWRKEMSIFLSLGKSSHLSDWDFHLSWPPWFPSEQKGKKRTKLAHPRATSHPEMGKSCLPQAVLAPALCSPHFIPFHRHLLLNTLVLPGTALLVHLNVLPKERKVAKNHCHVQFLIHSFGQREKSMRIETPIFSLALQNICEQAYVCMYICKTAVISEVCVKRSQRDGKRPAHPQLSPYFQLQGVLRRSRSSKTEAENICWEIKKKK